MSQISKYHLSILLLVVYRSNLQVYLCLPQSQLYGHTVSIMAFSLIYFLKTHSHTYTTILVHEPSRSLCLSNLSPHIGFDCWWLPGLVVSIQLRIWLSRSSSPMSSNKGNPLTASSRWSLLALASISCILQALLVHVSRYLVNSHWPFYQSIFGLCLYKYK